jgi:hypothetical protein
MVPNSCLAVGLNGKMVRSSFCNAITALATVIGSSNRQHATGETWEGAGCKEFDELFPKSPYTGPDVYQTRVAMGGRLDCE